MTFMVATCIILLALVLWLAMYFKRETKYGGKRELDTLFLHLYYLDSVGTNGEFYIFRDLSGKLFLQFRKVASGKTSDIQLSYPIVAWSQKYIPDITKILEKHNVEYRRKFEKANDETFPFRPEKDRDDCEFVIATFGNDSKKAGQVAKEIFLQVYKVPEGSKIWVDRTRNRAPE